MWLEKIKWWFWKIKKWVRNIKDKYDDIIETDGTWEKLYKPEEQLWEKWWEIVNTAQNNLLFELKKANDAKKRVETFSRIMDTFWIDAIIGLFTWLGDAWTSLIAWLYLLSEGKKAWLSNGKLTKIIGYQLLDALLWATPVLWDFIDFFYKANKKARKIFEDHLDKLVVEAIKKGVPPEKIKEMKINWWKISKHL